MFSYTKSLTSLDLSNFINSKIISHYAIFFGCESLSYIDISNLIVENNTELYFDLPENCQIKINKNIIDKIKYQPQSCKIIYKDEENI